VCNALSDVSGMRCYICNATISQLNEIKSSRERPVDSEAYRFGLSVLHAYIRCLECLLHISYRLTIQSWKVKIQEQFRQKMSLLVDVSKPNYRTSDDGNTAKRFFANPKLSAEITGMLNVVKSYLSLLMCYVIPEIDDDLIKRFGVILQV
ncbi:hypothetical protein ILUMI_17589, partial [Ignelater luminosus]